MIKLFDTAEDLLQYVPLNKGFEHTLLDADVDDALRDLILPFVSREQFDISVASNLPKHIELISLIKKAAANAGLAGWLPGGKVTINESGIAYGADKERQASSEDKADAIRSFKLKGYKAVDQLLEFLEANAAIFTIWKASDSYTVFTGNFVRSAKEFGIINGSRSVFLTLKPYITDVEQDYLNNIPATTYSRLLSRNYDGMDDDRKRLHERLLMNYIMPFVRDKSMSKAVRALAIIKDEFGTLTVFDNGNAGHAKGYKTPTGDLLNGWITDLEDSANNKLKRLADFLNANAADFEIPVEKAETRILYRNDLTHGTAIF